MPPTPSGDDRCDRSSGGCPIKWGVSGGGGGKPMPPRPPKSLRGPPGGRGCSIAGGSPAKRKESKKNIIRSVERTKQMLVLSHIRKFIQKRTHIFSTAHYV